MDKTKVLIVTPGYADCRIDRDLDIRYGGPEAVVAGFGIMASLCFRAMLPIFQNLL
jgi:hypothetical protein